MVRSASSEIDWKGVLQGVGIVSSPLCLLCFIAAFIAPFFLDRRRRTKWPESCSYRWGYFNGLMLLAVPGILGAAGGDLAILPILAVFYFPTGWFLIKRKRWAVIVGTLLSLNPLLWIINGIYFFRRWPEFAQEAGAHYSRPNPDAGKHTDDAAERWDQNTQPTTQAAFAILGLTESATFEQVREAYHELIKLYHPDRVTHLGEELKQVAERKTKEINVAFAVLEEIYGL